MAPGVHKTDDGGALAQAFRDIPDRKTPWEMPWRCFNCDEVFRDREAARAHFGDRLLANPACTESAGRLREVEALLSRYQEEDSDLDRKYHAMQAEHAVAVRRAEEDGYARGLADARKGLV